MPDKRVANWIYRGEIRVTVDEIMAGNSWKGASSFNLAAISWSNQADGIQLVMWRVIWRWPFTAAWTGTNHRGNITDGLKRNSGNRVVTSTRVYFSLSLSLFLSFFLSFFLWLACLLTHFLCLSENFVELSTRRAYVSQHIQGFLLSFSLSLSLSLSLLCLDSDSFPKAGEG